MSDQLASTFLKRIRDFVPSISMDCVVFGYQNSDLHVLLLRYDGTDSWALPGGFLLKNAEMEDAVADVLYDRTGLRNIFLTQYHTFSSVNRGWQQSAMNEQNFQVIQSKWPESDREEITTWFNQRFVSTAFMALVDASKVKPTPDDLSDACTWIRINELPKMALDHREMVEQALRQLRMKINYLPIGRTLLKDKFTMSEMQSLYEAILGEKLDRGNFQRKIMKLGTLIRHEKLMTGAQNKAPYLYSINHRVYDELLKKGIGFG